MTYCSDLHHDRMDAGLPHVPQQLCLRLAPQICQAHQAQPPTHLEADTHARQSSSFIGLPLLLLLPPPQEF